ncbi:hypothetical protein WJX74_008134 [Apatococcus lobatus]|uniref:Uncharacterized protein n=1 Tax=Apatococcus lobatus TaxID=904363 RepID=A0AAW1RRL0_9CHLO
MRFLVDSTTCSIWKAAAHQLAIPPQLVPFTSDNMHGTAVQRVLRNQAATLRNIRSFRPTSTHSSFRSDLAVRSHREVTWLLPQMGGHPFLIFTDLDQRDDNGPFFWTKWNDQMPSMRTAPPKHRIVPKLVAMDARTGQTSVVKPPASGVLQLNSPVMLNAHHAFNTPEGGYLFVGMAEARNTRCTQQLLLYRLGGVKDEKPIPGGALHLTWQNHVAWTSYQDKAEPTPPACSGTMLAIQVDNLKVIIIDMSVQRAQARFNIQSPHRGSGWVTDLAWSSSGRYLAVHTLAAHVASVEVWDVDTKRRIFQDVHPRRVCKADNVLLWADNLPSLIFTTRSEVQVLHVTEGPPHMIRLDRKQTCIHINMVQCRWDPTGDFIVAAAFKYPLRHEGPAAIFAANTGKVLLKFDMDGHKDWPVWLPPSSTFTDALSPHASQTQAPLSSGVPAEPPVFTSWCLLPQSHQMTGFSLDPPDSCNFTWFAQPHSQLSPDASVVVSLRVIDGPHENSHHRTPQALTDPFGYALGFRHNRLAVGTQGGSDIFREDVGGFRGMAEIQSSRRNKPAGATIRQTPQSHPFLMVWLPGTRIYAAAALGYLYIVDADKDRILGIWEDEPKEPSPCVDKAKAFRYTNGARVDIRRLDNTGRDGCQGLDWSPDRASLFMWTGAGCAMIGFGPAPELVELKSGRACLEPQLRHEKLPSRRLYWGA